MPFELLGAALVGIAVLVGYLAAFAVRAPSPGLLRLKEGEAAATSAGPALASALSAKERAALLRRRAMEALVRLGKGRAPTDSLVRRLKWAGISLSPEAWQMLPYPLAAIGAVLGAAVGELLPRFFIVALAVCAGAGAAGPSLLLQERLRARKARIARELLSYTEYLVMAMKAGADFRAAVGQVAGRFAGPVAEAFAAAVVGSGVGGRLDDGLRKAQEELNNPDADVLVDTLAKNLVYGSRCADMLLDIVQGVRKERVERVLERASRSALLMLLPTVVFTLPPMFFIVVYPMLAQASRFLHPSP